MPPANGNKHDNLEEPRLYSYRHIPLRLISWKFDLELRPRGCQCALLFDGFKSSRPYLTDICCCPQPLGCGAGRVCGRLVGGWRGVWLPPHPCPSRNRWVGSWTICAIGLELAGLAPYRLGCSLAGCRCTAYGLHTWRLAGLASCSRPVSKRAGLAGDMSAMARKNRAYAPWLNRARLAGDIAALARKSRVCLL